MNELQIIRTAVLELNSVNNRDVVKVAGILRKIKNWWQAFKDPQYRERVENLQQESSEVKQVIDLLGQSINDLQSAISNNDVDMYGDALERVRAYSAQLTSQVSNYEQSAQVAHSVVPEKVVEVPSEEITNVTQDMLKDPKIVERLKRQLPEGYDITIGKISQPAQNFNWMKQFTPDDIQIMPGPATKITTDLSRALTRYLELDDNETLSIVNADRPKLFRNISEAILNGQINKVEFSRVSEQISRRPANQMKMYMSAYNIPIPGTDIMFDIPNIVVIDLMASGRASKKLSVYWSDHLRVAAPAYKNYSVEASFRMQELRKFAFSKSNHQWARDILTQAFKQVMGRDPTLAELQLAQAVSWHESNYGKGWRADKNPDGRGPGSNNWGAVQCCRPKGGACPGNSFMYTDTHPTAQGVNVPYQVCFRTYPTPVDGAADVVKLLFKTKSRGSGIQQAAQQGSIGDFSSIMYDSHYYEGWGKTREERIAGHANRMRKTIQNISKSLNEQPQFADIDKPTKPVSPTGQVTPVNNIALNGVPPPSTTQQVDQSQEVQIMDEYNKLLPMLFSSTDGPVASIVRKAIERQILPKTSVCIKLASNNCSFPMEVRFARVLCSALREELGAESSIFENGKTVEIESDIYGNERLVLQAVGAVTEGISDAFLIATNGILVKADVYKDVKSSYNLLDSKVSEDCFRKFSFEIMSRE